ncbi:hypothetical protein HDU67_007754 [Dinochytrium kinnereticum]|nr:hypothetical protein HDU67_007754 [Dinochytrium kinnereticum]
MQTWAPLELGDTVTTLNNIAADSGNGGLAIISKQSRIPKSSGQTGKPVTTSKPNLTVARKKAPAKKAGEVKAVSKKAAVLASMNRKHTGTVKRGNPTQNGDEEGDEEEEEEEEVGEEVVDYDSNECGEEEDEERVDMSEESGGNDDNAEEDEDGANCQDEVLESRRERTIGAEMNAKPRVIQGMEITIIITTIDPSIPIRTVAVITTTTTISMIHILTSITHVTMIFPLNITFTTINSNIRSWSNRLRIPACSIKLVARLSSLYREGGYYLLGHRLLDVSKDRPWLTPEAIEKSKSSVA